MLEVDSFLERRALDAEPRLGRAVALNLVDPDEFVDASARRKLVSSDGLPRGVHFVIVELLGLRLNPYFSSPHSFCMSVRGIRRVGAKRVIECGEQCGDRLDGGVIGKGKSNIELDHAGAAGQPLACQLPLW